MDKSRNTVKAALTCVRDGMSSMEEAMEEIMVEAESVCNDCEFKKELDQLRTALALAAIDRSAIKDMKGPEVTE
ncbi:MAG: hypothetical protein FH756_02225 [Firmicutes bacterium]|nr:hypothetical protein [Bacillota bacterium]